MRGSRPAQGDPTGKQKELCRGMVMLLLPSRYGVLLMMGRALVKCEQSVCRLEEPVQKQPHVVSHHAWGRHLA